MKLSNDLREFIELLNSLKVEFVIVGAHALAWHGLPRYTKDVDFLINTSPENAQTMANLIDAFGFGSTGLGADDFQITDQVIQRGMDPNRIDILTGISGVTWEEAWASKVSAELDGLPVWYLGKDAYIKNKLASGRPQDIADVARLREVSEE